MPQARVALSLGPGTAVAERLCAASSSVKEAIQLGLEREALGPFLLGQCSQATRVACASWSRR